MVEKFLIDSNSFMTPYRQYYAFDLVPQVYKKCIRILFNIQNWCVLNLFSYCQ